MIANQFQRTANQTARVLRQHPLPLRVRVTNDLVGISGGAIHHRAIAIALQFRARRVFRRAQRGQKPFFFPRPQQNVIAPFGIRVFDAILRQLRSLFDGGRAGHITEPARMRTAHRDVERPVRQAFINEIVLGNDGGRMPHANAVVVTHGNMPSCWPGGF